MEHLSLSQSKSNMEQFNKQLQAIPRAMIERLGLRGHAGRPQLARRGCSPGRLAGAWQLCSGEKRYACRIRTMGEPRRTEVVCPPEIHLGRTGCQQQGGDQAVLWRVFWSVCVGGGGRGGKGVLLLLLDSHAHWKENVEKN